MSSLEILKSWFQNHSLSLKEDYFQFLRFQSISTDPSYHPKVRKCAEWLKEYLLNNIEIHAKLIETKGLPLVYAEDLRAGPAAPTLLVYGHYDVQPVDPLELWESDPFEPVIREGKIYARGAVDDKGQIFYAISALRAFKELGKKLPINVKFCIEGEEESASKGLSEELKNLKDTFKADFLLVIDFDQFDSETAAVSLGARGLVAFELILKGSKTDLHSGVHGGIAYNPNRALVELLSKVWDEKGRVQIDGFYEDVFNENISQYDSHFDLESYRKEFGVGAIGGEKGLSLAEKSGFRPTFEINGMAGGYTGSGLKTIIPSQACAKISCRLVPHQDPHRIAEQVIRFLKKHVVSGMEIEIHTLGAEAPFRGSFDSTLVKAVSLAASEVTKKPCKKVVSGGSIPVISRMVQELQVEVAGMGYGLPTDQIHAPNEHFEWTRFEKGFLTFARILELL